MLSVIQNNLSPPQSAQAISLLEQGMCAVETFKQSEHQTDLFRDEIGGILNALRVVFIEHEEAVSEIFDYFGSDLGYKNSRSERKRFWSWLQYLREKNGGSDNDVEFEPELSAGLLAVQRFVMEREEQEARDCGSGEEEEVRRSSRTSKRVDYTEGSRGGSNGGKSGKGNRGSRGKGKKAVGNQVPAPRRRKPVAVCRRVFE